MTTQFTQKPRGNPHLHHTMNPNSLKNLTPFNSVTGKIAGKLGGHPTNPLSITHRQKEKYLEVCPFDSQGRTWLEALSEGGMRQALNKPEAMSNLQDRHEGILTRDNVAINFNEIKIVVVEAAPPGWLDEVLV